MSRFVERYVPGALSFCLQVDLEYKQLDFAFYQSLERKKKLLVIHGIFILRDRQLQLKLSRLGVLRLSNEFAQKMLWESQSLKANLLA
jgi:hypothetical protein